MDLEVPGVACSPAIGAAVLSTCALVSEGVLGGLADGPDAGLRGGWHAVVGFDVLCITCFPPPPCSVLFSVSCSLVF